MSPTGTTFNNTQIKGGILRKSPPSDGWKLAVSPCQTFTLAVNYICIYAPIRSTFPKMPNYYLKGDKATGSLGWKYKRRNIRGGAALRKVACYTLYHNRQLFDTRTDSWIKHQQADYNCLRLFYFYWIASNSRKYEETNVCASCKTKQSWVFSLTLKANSTECLTKVLDDTRNLTSHWKTSVQTVSVSARLSVHALKRAVLRVVGCKWMRVFPPTLYQTVPNTDQTQSQKQKLTHMSLSQITQSETLSHVTDDMLWLIRVLVVWVEQH